jgi:hypothetical protein
MLLKSSTGWRALIEKKEVEGDWVDIQDRGQRGRLSEFWRVVVLTILFQLVGSGL